MILVPQMPEKVQYLLKFSFPLVQQLCEKTSAEKFVGGRKGYDKETLFGWLLIKKVTNWDYLTIASMAGVSHPTLMRANDLFLKKHIYEKVLVSLVKKARYWLKKCGYVLADKGYDWGDLVHWIVEKLHAKAGIPIKKHRRGKNYAWEAATKNFQLKVKGRTLKKSIYNKQGSIERVFSVLKRTYHLGKEETRGILNFAKNCYLALICYMLKLCNRAISIWDLLKSMPEF